MIMSKRNLILASAALLAAFSAVHATRILMGLTLLVGGVSVPYWLSFSGAVTTFFLSYSLFKIGLKDRNHY